MITEKALPRSKPEDQGVLTSAVEAFPDSVNAAELELHSFMLVRHGYVVAETWWPSHDPAEQHALYSLSKSFCSTAVGLAVDEGLLSVEDPIVNYFPNEMTPEIERNMGDMRIRHLLTMATGHAQDPTGQMRAEPKGNWIKGFLETPIKEPPGTRFVYNSGATYLLSAIVQQVTGLVMLDYLHPRLFEPLGIQGATWELCPQGMNTGGWGLSLKTEDIAKFGQLYLRKGVWNGNRLLSEEWVVAATSFHISTAESGIDKQQGYGYKFWRCRHGAYCGRGGNGQFCIVLPDQDAVIAITASVKNMQAVLDLIWEHLLPSMT